MAAELIKIYPENPDQRKIDEVVKHLRNGEIIIYPTDTVYSMGCSTLSEKAIEKLCRIKGIKPSQNNFSIVCEDLSNISQYCKVSNFAFKILKKNLPGPFTFILPTTNDLPKILLNRKTIGIRVPDHPIPHALTKALGAPLITTSVKDDVDDIIEYPNEIEQIYEQNQNKVDLIIDGGWANIIPSTVVDLTNDEVIIVREGAEEPRL